MIRLLGNENREDSPEEIIFGGSREANIKSNLHQDKSAGKFFTAFQAYIKTGDKAEYINILLSLGSTKIEAMKLANQAESQRIAAKKYEEDKRKRF